MTDASAIRKWRTLMPARSRGRPAKPAAGPAGPSETKRTVHEGPAVGDLKHLADARACDEAGQPLRADHQVCQVAGRLQVGHANGAPGVAEDRRAVPAVR